MTIAAIAVIVAAAATAASLIIYSAYLFFLHRKYATVPGPKRDRFFSGNLGEIVEATKKGKTREELLLDWHVQYGYTLVYFVYHKCFVSTIDPSAIQEVLLLHPRQYPKARHYKNAGHFLGQRVFGCGVLTETDYAKWVVQRKAISPAFFRSSLVKLASDFNKYADNLIAVLRPLSGTGVSFDISNHINNLSQDILSKFSFGSDMSALHGNTEMVHHVQEVFIGCEHALKSLSSSWSPFLYQTRKVFAQSIQVLRTVATDAIRERIRALRENLEVPDDVLSLMIRKHVSDPTFGLDIVTDNMFTLQVAGQETSANTLAFMVLQLGKHPTVLEKARQEVDQLIGSKEFISYDDACSLKYCEAIIKETLRLYAVVPATYRDSSSPIACGDVTVPAGATLQFSAFVCGRHPNFFPNPERFDPQRFYDGDCGRISPKQYFPFSLGPRACIGKNFALLEIKITLAKLLQHFTYTIDPAHGCDIHQSATMRPADGVWVLLEQLQATA